MSARGVINFFVAILSWMGIIFCFFLFPAFVLETSIKSLFELRLQNHRQDVYKQLSHRNEQITPYDDERKYFQKLLKRIFETASKEKNGLKYLDASLKRIKKNYPGQFEFVVWDSTGKIVDRLTDEKKYKYVLNKLYEVLKDVRKNILSGNPTAIKNLSTVKKTLNIVKQFLGRVFLPETLRYPYLNEEKAALILADYGRERPYFWYHVNDKFGLLAFISWDIVKGNHGLTKLCQLANRTYPDSFCGFAHISDLTKIYPPPPPQLQKEIIYGLSRFENVAEQLLEQENSLISIQMLNPKIRIFNIKSKDQRLFAIDARKNQILVKLSVLYLIGLVILIFNFRVRKSFFSIRWKLLFLFLYANAAPLSVLGFIAYDYLQHKTIALRNDIHIESARLLRDFDARFDQQKFEFSGKLNGIIKGLSARESSELSKSEIESLRKTLKRFTISETFLFDKEGETIFSFSADGKNIGSTVRYFKTLASAILKYLNKIILKADKSDVLSKITSPEDSDFVRNSVRDSRKIWPIAIGDTIKLGYWNFIGNPEKYENNFFLLLLWSEEEFQKIYLQNHFGKLAKNQMQARIFARTIKSRSFVPETVSVPPELSKFMNLTEEKKAISTGEIEMDGVTQVITGMVGNKLNQIILCAAFPENEIKRKVFKTQAGLMAGAVLSMLLTTVIGLLVARQFMSPVESLSNAALEINRQNYRHRITGMDQDEFGHLGAVINRVTEGLAEMEIAKVVQESLFPEEGFSQPPFDVYGKSVVMTTLGGDYYDFFAIDEENFGVIIGDVAGHGVSAALIMAMAKARVKMTTVEQRLNPSELLAAVHSIIHSLKSRNLKRMMTFQYFVLNSVSGKVTFSNAGHCYPLKVSAKQKSAEFIELIGQPLGVGKKPRFTNLEISLNSGEALILYTDGVIEAQNSKGEPMGYPGFSNLVIKSYNQNAQEYYQKIFSSYIEWTGEADDDTTMIVINRN